MSDPNLSAWVLAQLIGGMKLPSDFDTRQFHDEYAEAYGIYVAANGNGPDQLRAYLAQPSRKLLRQAVFAHQPGSPRPAAPLKPKTTLRRTPSEALEFIRSRVGRGERDQTLRECFKVLAALDAAAETSIRTEVIELLDLSSGDYRSLLAGARKNNPGHQPETIEEVLWVGQPRELRQVLDYVGGVAMTVVPLYLQTTVIEASTNGDTQFETERKLTPHLIVWEEGKREKYKLEEGLQRFNLTLRTGEAPLLLSRWSVAGVRDYLAGHCPDPARLLADIESALSYFVEFQCVRYLNNQGQLAELPAEHTQRMVALDIMSTYFMPIWPAVGYPLQTGEKESGKTTCQRLQADLSCMGAHITSAVTIAALKHMAALGYCLYFDDIENINDRNFDADKKGIILAGNTRGVKVPLMMEIEGKYQLVQLPVFCKKGFTNIAGIYDALGTRVLLIPMVRAFDKQKTERDPDVAAWPTSREKIVDDLYALTMCRLAEVDQLFRALEARPLADRERQIWAPILTLAQLCGGDEMRRQMIMLAIAKRHERQSQQRADFNQILVRVLFALVQESTETGVTPDTILDRMAEFLDLEKEKEDGEEAWSRSLITKVGIVMSNLRVYRRKYRPNNKVGAVYELDGEQIKQLAMSMNLVNEVPPIA